MKTTSSSESSYTRTARQRTKLKILRNEFTKRNKKNAAQYQIIRRKNIKINKLSSILEYLHQNNYLSATEFENFQQMPTRSYELISRFVAKHSGKKLPKKYPQSLKTFAMNLHFYSPRAYDYVRQEFNLCLPHPKTLSLWYMSIDAKPGFTKESFDIIEKAATYLKEKNKVIVANLVFDEMSIMKKIEWSYNKEEIGYVYNFDESNYNATPARQVLVFLLVALNFSWKLPLGYFPIDSCNAEQKRNMTTFCIEKLFNIGIDLVGVTFDGCPSNISMAKLLGCELNSPFYDSTFCLKDSPYSTKPLIITLDACHAIKLVRNAYANKRIIFDGNGGTIRWSFLEKLVALQETEQLHLGNKLRRNHVQFKNQIMKVRLATQLMSESVADALSYCAYGLNLPDFQGSDATIKFLKIMNHSFDILNSRNISHKWYKQSLCTSNYETTLDYANKAIEYISKLKFKTKFGEEYVVNSSRKIGFVGIIMGLKNVTMLYEKYILTGDLSFISFYKLSQDHIELFFCSCRSRLGYNNNPTVKQFMATYKRLLAHCEISDKGIGNCIPLDDIKILNTVSSVDHINSTVPMRSLIELSNGSDDYLDDSSLQDHDYIFNSRNLTEYTENVVEYIAGFIVRHLNKKLNCEICLSALQGSNISACSLTQFKNRGGLIIPAPDVIQICILVEKEIRHTIATKILSTKIVSKETFLKISINVLNKLLFKNMFSTLIHHQHYSILPKAVIETYLHIRFFYITRTNNEQISLRTKLNHITLWKNM